MLLSITMSPWNHVGGFIHCPYPRHSQTEPLGQCSQPWLHIIITWRTSKNSDAQAIVQTNSTRLTGSGSQASVFFLSAPGDSHVARLETHCCR